MPSEGAESGFIIDENEMAETRAFFKMHKTKHFFDSQLYKSGEGQDSNPCVQSKGRRTQLLLRRQGYTCKVMLLVVRPQQLSFGSGSFTQRVHLDSQSLLQTPQCALKEMCGNELWKFLMGNLVH